MAYPDDYINKIICDDVLAILRGMPDGCVHLIILSPPYFGLRDYKITPIVWEGDPDCNHEWGDEMGGGQFCSKCGAWRRQLGHEPSPELYISHLVQIFREIKRVMRKDATCWLNLGSTYASANMNAIQSRSVQRATAYDNDGKEQLNSQETGHVCFRSDDEFQDGCQSHLHHRFRNEKQHLQDASHSLPKDRDSEHLDSDGASLDVSVPGVQESTIPSSIDYALDVCDLEDKVSVYPLKIHSSFYDGLQFSHKKVCQDESQINADEVRDLSLRNYGNGKTDDVLASHKKDNVFDSSCKSPSGLISNNITNMFHNVKFKHKDLILIPFLAAIALQQDGWWIRSDIIWSKTNPMPESCTDRPTKSHEYVFLLTKSGENQYWTHRERDGTRVQPEPDYRWANYSTGEETDVPQDGDEWHRINLWRGHIYYYDADIIREPYRDGVLRKTKINKNNPKGMDRQGLDKWLTGELRGANKRSVWTIATQQFGDAHFATFPEKLIEPMILAGSSEKVCADCGAPWVRVTKRNRPPDYDPSIVDKRVQAGWGGKRFGANRPLSKIFKDSLSSSISVIGFRPTCACNAGAVPAVVLDPFMGSGTVAVSAIQHRRNFIGIDINPSYCKMAESRIAEARLQYPQTFTELQHGISS